MCIRNILLLISLHQCDSTFLQNCTSLVLGPEGGSLEVGNCQIFVPEGALRDYIELKLTSSYERNDDEVRKVASANIV